MSFHENRPGLQETATCAPGVLDPSHTILQSLLDCLCCTLEANEAAVCCCAFYPGDEVPWDSCDSGHCNDDCAGQAYIKVDRIYPTKPFPFEDLVEQRCDHRDLAMTIKMGVLRCAPTLTGRNGLPTPEANTEAAFKVQRDTFLIRSAIQCCFLSDSVAATKYHDLADRVLLGGSNTLGPRGGCVGVEIRATIRLSDACRCG